MTIQIKEILADKPVLYQESDVEFWTVPYISIQLLAAHLNQEFDGASRKISFIDESIKWLNEIVPAATFNKVIDFGCGPGLYAERLAKSGYDVTAIDFSENSIAYAKKQAAKKKLDIHYILGDYLNFNGKEQYDLALLIYCDYGALNPDNRHLLLKNIYQSLKPGGLLILDVFSLEQLKKFQIGNTWEYQKESGFWAEGEHVTFSRNDIYANTITLEQTFVLKDNDLSIYNIWHQYFTVESIQQELTDSDFILMDCFSTVKGDGLADDSETIALVVQKKS